MLQDSEAQEILRRLRLLEEENARLRRATNDSGKKVMVVEGEYKGHPTLSFQGPFRPFSLGLKKLRVIQETWPEIESFLQRYAKSHTEILDDDDKI